MSIKLEFINILIPIKNIEMSNIEGGFKSLLEEDKDYIGITKWYYDDLYREGAMNVLDIEYMLKAWEKRGLILFEETSGGRVWKDLCVVDTFSGLALPCDWIELDLKNYTASMVK